MLKPTVDFIEWKSNNGNNNLFTILNRSQAHPHTKRIDKITNGFDGIRIADRNIKKGKTNDAHHNKANG